MTLVFLSTRIAIRRSFQCLCNWCGFRRARRSLRAFQRQGDGPARRAGERWQAELDDGLHVADAGYPARQVGLEVALADDGGCALVHLEAADQLGDELVLVAPGHVDLAGALASGIAEAPSERDEDA